jgi:hypothetical protein
MTSQRSLRGQVAVVTGATGEVACGIAMELARRCTIGSIESHQPLTPAAKSI